MFTRHLLPCVPLIAIACLASESVATQHLVRAGDDWSVLKDRVKPGDEIILMPGKHREVRFDGLKGEANQPITIRSASSDARNLATIAAINVGIHLVDAEHVRIEHLLITGGRRAGVIVSGSDAGRSKHIALTSVYVAKTGDLAERAGILIDRTDHMTVKDCRIEAWHRAGIHIRGASDIALVNAQFVGSPSTPDEYGVLVDGRTSTVILQRCRFAPGISTAIALGPSDTSPIPPLTTDSAAQDAPVAQAPVLVDGITIERCLAKRPGTFITFGSVANALVRANTIVDPGVGYSFVEAPRGYDPVRGSTLLANLFIWTPGVMKSFSKAGGGAVPAGLSVETNLWHSAELPAARPLLGEFLGTVKSEQTLDVDPKLDGYDRPVEERAKLFGWTSA
jgi:hypothetical protein